MFGKAFPEMYTGSMIGAGCHVFATWGYAIANCDETGCVELNPKLLAMLLGASIDRVKEAIDYLVQPDPDSRSKEEAGCRLIKEGQFLYRIVNYSKYCAIRDKHNRREYQREWDRQNRPSGHKRAKSDTVRHSPTNPTHVDVDVDVDVPPYSPPKGDDALRIEFEKDFWPNVPTKIGKANARTAYVKARQKTGKQTILDGLPAYQRYETQRKAKDGNDFRPLHPATWLRGERWEDEVPCSPEPQRGDPDWLPSETEVDRALARTGELS